MGEEAEGGARGIAIGPAAECLAPLTASECDYARQLVMSRMETDEATRFVFMALEEPEKQEVLSYSNDAGPKPARRARVLTLNLLTGSEHDFQVDLDAHEVSHVRSVSGEEGRVPILDAEFEQVGRILQESPEWAEALARRGIDVRETVAVPLSPGYYPELGEQTNRVLRTFAFWRADVTDNAWAHPIDGLCAFVDPIERSVHKIVDHEDLAVPMKSENFHKPEFRGPEMTGLKPIEIRQPDGPSFTIQGHHISWANWQLDFGFDTREGLILRNLQYFDRRQSRHRDILYRASIAEMVVPYADPSPTRYWHNYFDTGEYLFARYTNSLELGCDCLGEIAYADVIVLDAHGIPRTVSNAICIHEEDYGTLWKHSDLFTGASDVRRQRRLVVSFFTTIGNYDYGFYWYLYLDGTIECEAKLTGILFPGSYPGKGYRYATEVAPGVAAPFHQHLFCARLDLAIDGPLNSAVEVEARRLPLGPENPYGNAFSFAATPIVSEGNSARSHNGDLGRVWHMVNPIRSNFVGDPPGYVLHAMPMPMLLADPSSGISARAAFAQQPVWFTAYSPNEMYPSGDLVNQNPGVGGIASWVKADRPLEAADLVLWHTFGLTHFPRPEDWPVMPVDYAGFKLTPYGFFDGNPVLDVPASYPRDSREGPTSPACH